MTTQEVAEKLVSYCRTGDFETCYKELYSPRCVSIEPKGAMVEIENGMSEIAQKGKNWNKMVAVMHGARVGDPIVAGDYFSLTMWNDITFKDGNRMQMDELCLYQVVNGKIIKEQFFYNSSSL